MGIPRILLELPPPSVQLTVTTGMRSQFRLWAPWWNWSNTVFESLCVRLASAVMWPQLFHATLLPIRDLIFCVNGRANLQCDVCGHGSDFSHRRTLSAGVRVWLWNVFSVPCACVCEKGILSTPTFSRSVFQSSMVTNKW